MKHEEFRLELQRIECNIQAADGIFTAWTLKLTQLLEADEEAFMKAITDRYFIGQYRFFIKRYRDALDELDELLGLAEDPKDFRKVCKTLDELRGVRDLLEALESRLQTIEELGS